MSYIIVGLAALVASALTLFSGFGLGTLLLPVFALFFPVEVAVAATAVVHGANNLFKLGLLRRHIDRRIVLRFGIPAVATAFAGAAVLGMLAALPALATWHLGAREARITPVKAVMGVLILAFAVFELASPPRAARVTDRRLLVGGALSGFFGGLSGHQGALRAVFLSPLRMAPAAFAATQAAIACMVDAARLLVYGAGFLLTATAALGAPGQWRLVAVATLCAFGGALLGRRLLPKITVTTVRVVTGGLLLIVGTALAVGLV